MNIKLMKLYKDAISSANEQYLPINEMDNLINICDTDDIAILAVDFFIINNKGVQPFEELAGFDSSVLFNQNYNRKDNVVRCNSFIRECFNKVQKELSGLYFIATLEYEV